MPPPVQHFIDYSAGTPAAAPSPAPAASTGPQDCSNCRKPGAALRCGICKKKSYCNRECQKSDWSFHKRICEKPKESPKPAAAPASSSSSEATSPAPAPSPSPKPAAPSSSSNEVELDEEDLAAIADVRKKGYAYHRRQLDSKELEMIGDIRPKLASPAPQPIASPTVSEASSLASSAAAAPSLTPTPVPSAEAGAGSMAKASEWNSGGTIEERDLSPWARGRVKELLRERAGELVLPLPGVGRLEVTGVTGWGGSTAEILISRGRAKRIYALEHDFGFLVEMVSDSEAATAAASGSSDAGDSVGTPLLSASGMELRDEGEDGEEAARSEGKKKKTKGADSEGGAAPVALASPAKRKKLPRAIVRFPDVSNDTEGSEREVRVDWGKPAIKEDQREMVRAALHNGGVVTALRGVVEALVREFMSK